MNERGKLSNNIFIATSIWAWWEVQGIFVTAMQLSTAYRSVKFSLI